MDRHSVTPARARGGNGPGQFLPHSCRRKSEGGRDKWTANVREVYRRVPRIVARVRVRWVCDAVVVAFDGILSDG